MKKEKSNPKPFLYGLLLCLFITYPGFNTFGQNLVSGKVLDEATNESMIGVTVLVKDTSTGTVTDLEGIFQVSAAIGSYLVIFYMEYVEQTELSE